MKRLLDMGDGIGVSKDKEFLTAEDVARFFHVAPRTVYNWTVNKKIPYYKIGGAIRFKWSDLEGWVQKGKRGERLPQCFEK